MPNSLEGRIGTLESAQNRHFEDMQEIRHGLQSLKAIERQLETLTQAELKGMVDERIRFQLQGIAGRMDQFLSPDKLESKIKTVFAAEANAMGNRITLKAIGAAFIAAIGAIKLWVFSKL